MATAAVTTDTNLSLSAAYTYENDLLTKLQTASTTYDFTYGDFALRSSVKIGERTLASYTYTDDGNNYLSALDYGNGDKVQYEYDGLGRVTKQTYEDGDAVTYQYDNSGALATATDSATGRKTTYYYDLTDRLMKYVETGSNYYHSVGYEYNADNNLTSLVETINGTDYTTSYVYDDDNRVTSVTTGGTTVEYIYDDYGRVTTQVTKRGETTILTETFTYVGTDTTTSTQIATHTIARSNFTGTYTYTYDDNGNITSIDNGRRPIEYTYDSANQLIEENNGYLEYRWVWEYDNAGNILSQSTYWAGEELGTALHSTSYQYNDTDWGDLLTGYIRDGTSYTISSDTIGNPISDGKRTYNWEHGRQLSSLTQNNTTWNYSYDSSGMRTSRSDGVCTYEYVYSGDKLVQMTVDGYKFYFTYDANGTPLTVTWDETIYFYVTNIRGDVIGIITESGEQVVWYYYDAWGNVTIDTNFQISEYNPLLYRGYVYDFETGLYYLQSRYYDPALGRFINSDTYMATGNSLKGNNMFAYCLNNPVNMADSNGKDAIVVVEFKLDENGLPIVGHISVYIQDAEGNWYVTQFTGTSKRNAKVHLDSADEVMLSQMLNGEKIAGKQYEYFKGNFAASYEYASALNGTNYGGYNFFINNCADYAHDVLSKGTFSVEDLTTYLDDREPLVPINYLWRLQFREQWIKVKQLAKEVMSSVEAYYS